MSFLYSSVYSVVLCSVLLVVWFCVCVCSRLVLVVCCSSIVWIVVFCMSELLVNVLLMSLVCFRLIVSVSFSILCWKWNFVSGIRLCYSWWVLLFWLLFFSVNLCSVCWFRLK